MTARKTQIQETIDSKVPTVPMLLQITSEYENNIMINASNRNCLMQQRSMHACLDYLCQQKRENNDSNAPDPKSDPACSDFASGDPCNAITDIQGDMDEAWRAVVQAS